MVDWDRDLKKSCPNKGVMFFGSILEPANTHWSTSTYPTKLENNERCPANESRHNRCNLFARLDMQRLQVVDATAKKF